MCEPSNNGITISENDQRRSEIVHDIVQNNGKLFKHHSNSNDSIPKIIVQYWDDPNSIPNDVHQCLKTWDQLSEIGCKRLLFNDQSARNFISKVLSQRHLEAYDRCYHPAMKSDYFRLCFILAYGGCYVDADDSYCGTNLQYLFSDKRLKLQPLCYDISTDEMLAPDRFTQPGEYSHHWIFYLNNNPIVAPPGDPVIRYALRRATQILLKSNYNNLPDIQSTTGPGNLTASLVAQVASNNSYKAESNFLVLSDWKTHARTVWSLSYRDDKRNWRLSNRQNYFQED